MKLVFLTRGLCAAALLLSLAACGGGSGSDAGALGATAAGNQAPAAQKPDGTAADGATADNASSQSLSWAP
ncbi:hypothetical protein J7E70_25000 [Variovorax paradoxus]|nr:hypothetical protein [Variovorax paradoxus]MBT2303708.1 hypothetical protein [Variovorax paradoxus]